MPALFFGTKESEEKDMGLSFSDIKYFVNPDMKNPKFLLMSEDMRNYFNECRNLDKMKKEFKKQ
jgi:hypothetical protein